MIAYKVRQLLTRFVLTAGSGEKCVRYLDSLLKNFRK